MHDQDDDDVFVYLFISKTWVTYTQKQYVAVQQGDDDERGEISKMQVVCYILNAKGVVGRCC